jgi:hypothetical protein
MSIRQMHEEWIKHPGYRREYAAIEEEFGGYLCSEELMVLACLGVDVNEHPENGVVYEY